MRRVWLTATAALALGLAACSTTSKDDAATTTAATGTTDSDGSTTTGAAAARIPASIAKRTPLPIRFRTNRMFGGFFEGSILFTASSVVSSSMS